MTGTDRKAALAALESRFDSGSWDELDVVLLLGLSNIAAASPSCQAAVDAQFEGVMRTRLKRAEVRSDSGRRDRQPTEDEAAGMAWWNDQPEAGRYAWLQRAGVNASIADAWRLYKQAVRDPE